LFLGFVIFLCFFLPFHRIGLSRRACRIKEIAPNQIAAVGKKNALLHESNYFCI